ncbi:sensor histidine kinase [Agromyces intestinalis]|uniref:histidine kinase n=1 Tax=Agromyces intestinalis TaxID=2592652 RepID=A0A5C1YGM6_9MICO|nr:histidine kinase [Agromyces intestinalis]QEO13912.1 sensor histidine kinase [Agromyces intestinalis]
MSPVGLPRTARVGSDWSAGILAAVCWLVIAGVLVALPAIAPTEPAAIAAPPGSAPWWATLAAVTAQSIALPWARRMPVVVLTLVAGIAFVLAWAVPPAYLSLATLAYLIAVYLVFSTRSLRSLWRVLALAAGIMVVANVVAEIRSDELDPAVAIGLAIVQTAVATGLPLLLALVVFSRREAREAHSGELRALARERDALVQASVARERAAMARELHDIAAHHLSGIALMASAIHRQIDRRPAEAKESVLQVRDQSIAVLADLRRVVGLLRGDDAAELSLESLATVAELVATAQPDGTATEFVTVGDAPELGAGVGPLAQLTAYRMVQESLANAALHAPGAGRRVTIDDSDSTAVTITVTHAPAAPSAPGTAPSAIGTGGGFGLIGMRERAELVGGELSYGRTADGGWQVRLRLARDRAAGTAAPDDSGRTPGVPR